MMLTNHLFNKHREAILRSTTLQDCSFLSIAVFLSFVLYFHQLGFYSDDWSFLSAFDLSEDRSLRGIFESAYSPHVRMRPVQIFYLASLYWLFGLNPLGYHLVNVVMILIGTLLLYGVLIQLKQPRLVAVLIPLIYTLIPHYSTNRFWYAAFQTTLSLVFYLLSLLFDLEALKANSGWAWFWKGLGIIGLFASSLAYEVTLPLFLLNPCIVWYQYHQTFPSFLKSRSKRIQLIALNIIQIIGVISVFIFKLKTTVRTSVSNGPLDYVARILKRFLSPYYTSESYGLNLKQSFLVNYIDSGLMLPYNALKLMIHYPNLSTIGVGCLLYGLIFVYTNKIMNETDYRIPGANHLTRLFALGILLFYWGYAIFFMSFNVQFTATGIGNRTAFAAAIGVAISLFAGIGWISASLFKSNFSRKRFFCAAIALFCTSGFLINNTLGTFWVKAYQQEQTILSQVKEQFPSLPSNTTLLLDGICPYLGPAIIFESSWDFKDALVLIYQNHNIQADVVKPTIEIKKDGIYTRIYDQSQQYPYDNLMVYNFTQKRFYSLPNTQAAREYLKDPQSNYNSKSCPSGYEGLGVKVF